MDPLKLLSRSTKLSRTAGSQQTRTTPSSGQHGSPQLSTPHEARSAPPSKKRKRKNIASEETVALDFFGGNTQRSSSLQDRESSVANILDNEDNGQDHGDDGRRNNGTNADNSRLSEEDKKAVLKSHKLKVTWLIPSTPQKKDRRQGMKKRKLLENTNKQTIYPQPIQSFTELRDRFGVSGRVAWNVEEQGYTIPTEVQLGALPLLLDSPDSFLPADGEAMTQRYPAGINLLTVAPTGSGKTLAFMIPLLDKALRSRQHKKERRTLAIVLAPTKELAGQIVNEGRKLARDTGVRVTQVKKGMKLACSDVDDEGEGTQTTAETVVKSDVLVSTPGILLNAIDEAVLQGSAALAAVEGLILDEADVLLDPLFRDQTLRIWNHLAHKDLRVSLWSATMGSNVEELARQTISEQRTRISEEHGQDVQDVPLIRLVVGLKDSAVSNVEHKLVYAATENGKLMGLRQLLHPATTSKEAGPPLLPPFLVFTQTIERAIALHAELLYDIPAEAGGISRIAVLHSDLSDTARDSVMTKFRKGEIWVLITTDLLSRGVDFRGVNGVVNYDIPTSSAAYVHRVGRTGRAGREGGVAVTLYSKEDVPYLKPIANLIATASKLKDSASVANASGVQSWLLDALPKLSKKTKQDLKHRGVETRSAHGRKDDAKAKAARRTKISTKAGFLRKEEHRKKGAIEGSRRRQQADFAEEGDETDFGGFD